jgi:hypothetical protein
MKFAILLASASILFVCPALAGTVIPLDHFSSVKASDGGHVIIRHGAVQQVTLVKGSTEFTRFNVRDGKLDIVTCDHNCPHNYSLEVEIVAPEIIAIAAEDGGSIEMQGAFPAQEKLSAWANDGGRVDARAITASQADAKAEDGGEVLVHAASILNAAADDGGNVQYWGNPIVNRTVSDGGNVEKGS